MFKKVRFIINPAAGQKEPILNYINDLFYKTDTVWDVVITQKIGDATELAHQAIKDHVDIIAVYGGDGTVGEVAQALCGHTTPLAILPGGTANVMAKELQIPTNTIEALHLLKKKHSNFKTIDMAKCNDQFFLLRIEFGVTADIVKNTNRRLKDTLGQLAYSISALKHLHEKNYTNITYNLVLDDKKITVDGAALIITNAGNFGIPGITLSQKIDVTDGKLDVILIEQASIPSFFSLIKHAFFQTKDKKIFQHWQAKKILIKSNNKQAVLCDDIAMKAQNMNIEIIPKAVRILVPIV
jgi:diacylglycerol kinase (ATP)